MASGSAPWFSARAEFVICPECGWTLKNDGEFDLIGQRCGYGRCNATFDALPKNLLDLTRENWARAFATPRAANSHSESS